MQFTYLNHRGEKELRNVTPVALVFMHVPGSVSPFLAEYEPGWFLECVAHDRNDEIRHFGLSNIDTVVGGNTQRYELPGFTFGTPIS